jgi:GDP-L-fucose synthase
MIQCNVIDAAFRHGAKKLVFMGTSCIYPREPAHQPITEDLLLTGPLEPTNQWYAIAKIAGIKMCEAYRRQHGFDAVSVMPANLYGPGDYFDLENAHVIPALMRKFHEAKVARAGQVEVWGSGTPRREFLYVDDLADAVVFVMENYSEPELINIGTGEDIAIGDLARKIAGVVGFKGDIVLDRSRPDGVTRRILDSSKLARLGWRSHVTLDEGLAATYGWFRENIATARLGDAVEK